jgi:hypothetical protein
MVLYEGEEINLYDPETGSETDRAQELRENAEVDSLIADSQKFESLLKNRGWKLLVKWLHEVDKQYTEMLVNEQDPKKIARLQEAIKCYRNVEGFVKFRVAEGKEFLERKRTLEIEANPKE